MGTEISQEAQSPGPQISNRNEIEELPNTFNETE